MRELVDALEAESRPLLVVVAVDVDEAGGGLEGDLERVTRVAIVFYAFRFPALLWSLAHSLSGSAAGEIVAERYALHDVEQTVKERAREL